MNRRAPGLRRLGPTEPVRVPPRAQAHKWEPGPGTEDVQLAASRAEAAGPHGAAREGRLRLRAAGGGGPGRPRPRCERRLSPVAICPAERPGPELPPPTKNNAPTSDADEVRALRPEYPAPPPPPTPAGPGEEMAKKLRVRRRPGLRLLLLPWRRLVPLFGGRSGSLAGGGGRRKIPPRRRSGAPVSKPSRGPRPPTFCGSLRADVQVVAVAAASCGSRLSLSSGARAPHSGLD